jgi:hypothetical protein
MGERIQETPANALLAQLVEHFHGKEGVVGSSPTEGFPVSAGISVPIGDDAGDRPGSSAGRGSTRDTLDLGLETAGP